LRQYPNRRATTPSLPRQSGYAAENAAVDDRPALLLLRVVVRRQLAAGVEPVVDDEALAFDREGLLDAA